MKMSKCENIFDQVQKRTPYQVPENYFVHSKSRLRPASHRSWYWGIAASFVLVAGIWSLVRIDSPSSPTTDTKVNSSAVIILRSIPQLPPTTGVTLPKLTFS